GLAPGLEDEISETVELMDERAEQFGRHTPTEKNPAKSLALRLVGKLPLVYGSEGLAEVAAYRWKCQFNETSKVGSYWNVFSELDHNEVVGWGRLPEITRNFALLVLRHAGEHPRIGRRIEVTLPLIGDALAWVDQFEAKGTSPLARLCDLFYLGDFASTYLALAQGIDPAPVEVITKLKQSL
ncbi:MAG: SIS domain-containing protein, partial [Candidatus Methylomirabilales bacterium]